MSRRSDSRPAWIASWHGAATAPDPVSSWLGARNGWASSAMKGRLGEALTDTAFTRGWVDGTRYKSFAPHRSAGRGLDHLFVGRDVVVGETKFETSRLSKTRDGRQLSTSWVRPRLEKTIEQHDDDSLRDAVARRHLRRVLVRILRRHGLQLKIHDLDEGATQRIRVPAKVARQQLEKILGRVMSRQEARRVSAEVARDPRILDRLDPRTPHRWAIGLDRGVPVAIAAGVAFDLAMQLVAVLRGGAIDGGAVVHSVARTSATSAAGYYVARQTHARLLLISERMTTTVAVPAGLLSFGAGALSVVAISAGQWALGLIDRAAAVRTGVSGLACVGGGALFNAGLFATASTFGSAGTGTAIATLHGAAAKSATLAWIGVGSASIGAAVATGGALAIGVALAKGVDWLWSELDERARGRLVRFHADVIASSLER